MLVEGCKHELEITVPPEEIERETERVLSDLQKKVRLPGFRPGKAPASLIRSRFASEVRQDVLEKVVPRSFRKRMEEEELQVVGTPNVKDVHFHEGEPLTFKAEFEVAPTIELGEYRGLTTHYAEPSVSDEEIAARVEKLREGKAQFVNIDPRPVENGDYAVVDLRSIAGVEPPIEQNDMVLHVGDPETMPAFTEALAGMSPEEEKEFEVTYPEDYEPASLAGKTVRFHLSLKMLRLKELPELNDEFAKDLGDFQSLDDVREAVRKTIAREKEIEAQQKAKSELIDRLVEAHDFPIPEAFIERQIEMELEGQFRELADGGVDVSKLRIDWDKLKESHREKAKHNVKASLLVDKISEREQIETLQDELDREVQRIARQEREPAAATRKKLEKSGGLGRIAHRIRAEKTVNFLFEHARKEAPSEAAISSDTEG